MNISKFDIREMYNNSKGKTSLMLVCAHMVVFSGCYGFVVGVHTVDGNTMIQSIAMVTIGSTLLGVRRFTPDKEIKEEATKTN